MSCAKITMQSNYGQLNVPNLAQSWRRQFDGVVENWDTHNNHNIVLPI
jgi:hypothetical protein